jgi:uracil-DNA glycosylase family protein
VTAADFLPAAKEDLASLREASAACRGCGLFERATQTVFGAGPKGARVMLVGEQPGDQEDRRGVPFVGPAGHLLDRALDEAGIPRGDAYLTNAVKHFKWEPRGKVRLHKKPSAREVTACKPWLLAEIAAVDPALVVCLGATAAQAILGREFRVTKKRGEVIAGSFARPVMATVHPSAVLRERDEAAREDAFRALVADLGAVSSWLSQSR